MKRVIALIACAATGACGHRSALPYFSDADMNATWLSDRAANASGMHRVGSFRLVDQHDSVVTENALNGRITVAHFFFTACGDVCPLTTANLQRVLHELANNPAVQVLSYSVTPTADSVQALAAYAGRRGIHDPRWHLLTGARADIERLARESYFVRLGADATYGVKSIAHTESVLLVDGRGRIRGVYAGVLELEMNRLRDDIVTLSRESAN